MIDFDPGPVVQDSAWLTKTLGDLRSEARSEATGIAFDALRVKSGPRIALVLCVTGTAQISLIAAALGFVDDGRRENWSTVTLADMFGRSVRSRSVCAASDGEGALVLSAADPCSISKLSGIFSIPN